MKTALKFPLPAYDALVARVQAEVIPNVPGLSTDLEKYGLAIVVANTLHSADCSAGNGVSSTSHSFANEWAVSADVSTGEIRIYRKV